MNDSSESDVAFSSLGSITRGASFFMIGRFIYYILGFLLNLLLTRGLGASLYGVYAYANTLVAAGTVFTNLGSDKSILKYLPEYEDQPTKQNNILGLAVVTSFLGSVLVGGFLYIFSPLITDYTLENPLLVDALQVFTLILICDTLVKVIHSVFRGLERMRYQVLIDKITRPTLRLFAAGIALLLGYSFVGVMAALAVASILLFVTGLVLLFTVTDLTPTSGASRDMMAEYYNFSIPLTIKDAGAFLYNRVDVLMVGVFLSSSAVGIYNVAVLLSSLLSLPLAAFSQLFPPVASRLYSNGQHSDLNSVYAVVTRWTFTISLLLAIGAFIYRAEILALFGEDFVAGETVLVLFILGQLLNNAVGPSGYVLMMTEHQYVLLVNQVGFGLLNVALNYIFITQFGITGAALATATVLGALNIVRISEVWYLEQLFPYSIQYAKPLLAGIGAGATMFVMREVVGGLILIVGGGSVGAIVYAILLGVQGIEDEDEEFFRRAVSRFTN